MKRYDKYISSGISAIGDIPSHWQIVKYRRLFTISSGEMIPRELESTTETKYPIYGGNGIRGYATDFNNTGPMLLIGRVGAKCGNIHVASNEFWVSEHALRVFPRKEFVIDYFKYLLEVTNFNQYAITTAQPLINSEIVLDKYAPIPPLTEQILLANYLDLKTFQIDKLISDKQKLIELLKEERTAIINKSVIGEGKNWERKKLKYVSKKIQTGNTPPSGEEKYYTDEVNWYTPSDFSENLLLSDSKRKVSQLAIDEGVVKVFPANSMLFVGIGATLGKVGYILEPATSNQQINCISFSSEEEAIFYTYYFYSNRPNIVSLSNSATLAILNQAQMKDIDVPVTSDSEEIKKINLGINTEIQRIYSTVSHIEKEIELLQEYRTALISEVVTGKIKVI